MKKWLILLVVIVVVVAGWYYIRETQRFVPEWLKPEFGKIERGDIRVPITASGLIEPDERIIVKSKASGEVIDVKVQAGDFVHAGQELVLLKKDDEQRAVDRNEAALKRAEAALEQAKISEKNAIVSIARANAQAAEFRAALERADFNYKRTKGLFDSGQINELEHIVAKTTFDQVKAQLAGAEAAVQAAEHNLREATEAIKIQDAVVSEAKKSLEDSRERLSETTIKAPQDAIVTEVQVVQGMLVQSGTSSFTGGSPVLELADISMLKVLAKVDEADYGRVMDISPIAALPEIEALRQAAQQDAQQMERRSGTVEITVDAFPELTFTGRISRVEPQGKLNVGASIIQYDVHVDVTDERRYMLPLGTQAQVEFTVESVSQSLIVPADAVKSFETKRGVWIKDTSVPARPGVVNKRFVPCRFGITDGAHTHLIEALGDVTLTEGMEVFTKIPSDNGD